MNLLFGQIPSGEFVQRQFPDHALVGSVADEVPRRHVPVGDGRVFIRRSEISASQEADEDVILALAALFVIDTTHDP